MGLKDVDRRDVTVPCQLGPNAIARANERQSGYCIREHDEKHH